MGRHRRVARPLVLAGTLRGVTRSGSPGADSEESLWLTVAGLDDRETTCAIVSCIRVSHDKAGIPKASVEARAAASVFQF